MKLQKIKTQYVGVRYYEHATRKMRNGQADRYFSIRYKSSGKTIEEGVGWASTGWNAEKVHTILSKIKANRKTGNGPQSLAQMRAVAENNQQLSEEQAIIERETNITVEAFFDRFYTPHIKRHKRDWKLEVQRFNKIIRGAIGKKTIRSITLMHVQQILDSLIDTNAAPSTVKHYMK